MVWGFRVVFLQTGTKRHETSFKVHKVKTIVLEFYSSLFYVRFLEGKFLFFSLTQITDTTLANTRVSTSDEGETKPWRVKRWTSRTLWDEYFALFFDNGWGMEKNWLTCGQGYEAAENEPTEPRNHQRVDSKHSDAAHIFCTHRRRRHLTRCIFFFYLCMCVCTRQRAPHHYGPVSTGTCILEERSSENAVGKKKKLPSFGTEEKKNACEVPRGIALTAKESIWNVLWGYGIGAGHAFPVYGLPSPRVLAPPHTHSTTATNKPAETFRTPDVIRGTWWVCCQKNRGLLGGGLGDSNASLVSGNSVVTPLRPTIHLPRAEVELSRLRYLIIQ